nr:MAG TPA: hypothetical protein [Caudoviricetes sp.]
MDLLCPDHPDLLITHPGPVEFADGRATCTKLVGRQIIKALGAQYGITEEKKPRSRAKPGTDPEDPDRDPEDPDQDVAGAPGDDQDDPGGDESTDDGESADGGVW